MDVHLHRTVPEHRPLRHGCEIGLCLRRVREMPLAVYGLRRPLLQDVDSVTRAPNATAVATAAAAPPLQV